MPCPIRALLTSALVAASLFAPAAKAADLTVFAAASLKTALDEIGARWRADTGHAARFSYAGSSDLARQIAHGAPADVFISANLDWMDRLEAEGLILTETRFDLAANRLVVIAHGRGAAPMDLTAAALQARLGEGVLAMALVGAVPAGIYGKAAMESLGLWDGVAPRVAQADNVRAALALVAAGEAPLGIVYATDAAAGDAVTVVATFPEDSHPPITYPAAAVADGDAALAADFLAYLKGPAARAALAAQGFLPPAD